jgi:hypothetical protein
VPESEEKQMRDLARLTHRDFAPHRGSSFELRASDALRVALELVEVLPRSQASGPRGEGRGAFSLLFAAGAGAPTLPQRLYRLEHPSLGALELFLVPIGPKNGAMQYEAVFT